MLQILCTLLIFMIIIFPVGKYVYHISTMKKTFADSVFNRVDNFLYKTLGIDTSNMGWKKYALTLLLVNAFLVFIGYLILRVQSLGILNPNSIENMEESLSFNTIISFMTNTNLQHYSGESSLSYFSCMFVIIMMMFTSAASCRFSNCLIQSSTDYLIQIETPSRLKWHCCYNEMLTSLNAASITSELIVSTFWAFAICNAAEHMESIILGVPLL